MDGYAMHSNGSCILDDDCSCGIGYHHEIDVGCVNTDECSNEAGSFSNCTATQSCFDTVGSYLHVLTDIISIVQQMIALIKMSVPYLLMTVMLMLIVQTLLVHSTVLVTLVTMVMEHSVKTEMNVC